MLWLCWGCDNITFEFEILWYLSIQIIQEPSKLKIVDNEGVLDLPLPLLPRGQGYIYFKLVHSLEGKRNQSKLGVQLYSTGVESNPISPPPTFDIWANFCSP